MSSNSNSTEEAASAAASSFDDATIAQCFQAIEQLVSVFGFDAEAAQAAVEAVGPDVTAAYNYILDQGGEDTGGPIVPITDCPHVQHHVRLTPSQLPSPRKARCQVTSTASGKGNAKSDVSEDGTCPSTENWLCLQCGVVGCSRYVNGHGLLHYKATLNGDEKGPDGAGHCIAASLSDLSVWCHACGAYLRHTDLDPLVKKLEQLKFENEEEETAETEDMDEGLADASTRTIFSESTADDNNVDPVIPFLSVGDVISLNSLSGEAEIEVDYPFGSRPNSLNDVARFIQSDQCQSIVVLAGAGMSVTSGIPDYRSAGGLYHTLQPDQLTASAVEREAIRADPTVALEQRLFIQNQLPCLEVKRPFILGTQEEIWKATIAHRFVELLHQKTGKLTRLYTQNIDGLEAQCHNLPRDKVVAVHGSMDRAECAYCGATSDFDAFCNQVRTNIKDVTGQDLTAPKTSTPIKCQVCGNNTVKPAIVLFRSKLPEEFFRRVPQDIPNVDLLIVIGTSLAVAPANTLVFRVPETALRVVINDEPVGWRVGIEYGPQAKRDYFAQGHCDDITLDLIEELGWFEDLKAHIDDLPEESAGRVKARISLNVENSESSDA